jgi:hypothetical protein
MIKTAEIEKSLTASDRCDSCNAAAKVVVTFLNGELMFCGHHAKELAEPIIKKSISIYDPDEFI